MSASTGKDKHDFLAKVIIIGDSGVGKTNLLLQFCDGLFQDSYVATLGVDFKLKNLELDGHRVKLQIWDTAGQERFRNITKSFYKGAHGIILTYSITEPSSFAHIENWVDQIREVGNPDTDMILVASKADLEMDRKVPRKQGETLAEKYGIPFIETSAKADTNIGRVF